MHSRNCFSPNVKRFIPAAAFLAVAVMVLLMENGEAMAHKCKSVNAHLSSQQVANFSDGTPCPSSICTEGRFIGVPNGKFRFIATGQYPAFAVDPQLPPFSPAGLGGSPSFAVPWMFFTTGEIRLDTAFCGKNGTTGTLVLRDATTFAITANSPDLEGQYGDAAWVDGAASTGTCAGASGLLTGTGFFKAGCVDCDYEGKVCRP